MDTQAKTVGETKKKRGRPRGANTVMIRAQVTTVAKVEAWAAAQTTPINRLEALDELVRRGLEAG